MPPWVVARRSGICVAIASRPPCAADRYTCPPAGRQHLYRTRLNKSGSIHCHPEQGVSDVEPNARTGVPAAPAGSDRKSVVSGQSVSVRVDLGGRLIIKKKT